VRWIDLDVDELIARHQAGESLSRIAREMGCSVWTVTDRLARAGIDWRRVPIDEGWLAARLDEGLSRREIAQLAGRHPSAIKRAAHRIGRRGEPDRPHPELTDRAWLAARIECGDSDREIAEQIGAGRATVHRWRKRHGLRRPTDVNR
jgi:DNA invertase Pin-like site-specific DNA recombinase